MSKITEVTTDVTIHTTKSDDGWDYPISREEWEEIMKQELIWETIEDDFAIRETLADLAYEEKRKEEEVRKRRSGDRLNDPYIFDMYGDSYEEDKDSVDPNEW